MRATLTELTRGFHIAPTRPEHAAALAALQDAVFPTLAPEERFRAEHYENHIALFPDGQFVALAGERVVGATSTIRMSETRAFQPHAFADVIEQGWLTSHEPSGSWLYGVDIGTHPDYRRRGIARALYRARHDAVRSLALEGQVTVGMLRGYGAVKQEMTAEDYYASVVSGQRVDPTITTQLKMGFEPRRLVSSYLNDPVCDGFGVLLVLPAAKDIG